MKSKVPNQKNAIILVIVAALGYFVDIYDLILFNVIKKESLIGLGITDPMELKRTGISLFNWQMGGMLVGGLLWGILGDKRGRLKVLFGSILMYSAANLINAFVTDIEVYAGVRFIAGIGLAGELGAGITLVSEVMSKEMRGYGTMIIVTFGALGAVLAAQVGAQGAIIGKVIFDLFGVQLANWQVAYIVGGSLGVMLLLLRLGTLESEMFILSKNKGIKRGDFLALLRIPSARALYFHCISIGLPIWFTIGVLIALAEQFAVSLGIKDDVVNGTAVMYAYLGLSAGDLLSGLLSQLWRSRKKVVMTYLVFTWIIILVYLFASSGKSGTWFYSICFMVGLASGYWALFVTIAAEQFGTNIRSTVTTTVPNFVRGSVIPITASFNFLENINGPVFSALIVGSVCVGLAAWSTYKIKETFAKDLDYIEVL